MSTCQACGKVKYHDFHDAQVALVGIIVARNIAMDSNRRQAQKHAEKRRERRIYPCRACGTYHLTSERWVPQRLRLKQQP